MTAAALPFPLRLPIIGAPMAGRVSTPALVAAVSDAGGLGMLAAGYLTVEQLLADVVATRELTRSPYGVNIFLGEDPPVPIPVAELEVYAERLAPIATRLGVHLGHATWADTEDALGKAAALSEMPEELRPRTVSFTFGAPTPELVDVLHRAAVVVGVTVTDRAEALAARDAGADYLVVQGVEAGGHRGTHRLAAEPSPFDHLGLLDLCSAVGLPLVAAGGITTAADTARALHAGAAAVQVGTALLLTPEAGTSPAHRMAIASATATTVTRAFTGRPARGVSCAFAQSVIAPAVYPQVHQISAPLRAAAAAAGDTEWISAWAGVGFRAAKEQAAGDVVRGLAADLAPQ